MGSVFSQTSRMGRLTTALGPNTLVLMRFDGRETLNGLFDWHVDCLAAQPDIDFDALIGTHATVTLVTRQGERPFDGIVTEARWLGAGENGHRYRLRLQPWFWLASLRRNQRIFHQKTVVEILQELLGAYADAGGMDVRLTSDYPVLEYTVQYRESDMAFATRMMERHGISYHFTHAQGRHDMVVSDMADTHDSIGMRPFHPDDGHHQEDIDHFWEWRPARRITTGAIRLTDYNFKTPTAAMEVDRQGGAAHLQGQIESFDWPGDYGDQGRGKMVAELRSNAERGQDRRYDAEGDVVGLGAGIRVTLGGDKVPGLGDEYLCLGATHSYTSDNYGTGGTSGDGYAYSGRYLLMPVSAPMLPELKTPRADVKGPQTAVVVGEGEIDCDEYGRILVQFHWDLDAAYSMRCRVSQSWAGGAWGGMVIPRVKMEVLVEFLDGDPDKPLVTGCVFNGKNPVPYALPANKTKSIFRTDTHEGTGYNELSFEDAAGKEDIFLHAQKDHTIKVLNNQTANILANRVDSVGQNASVAVGKNAMERVGANKTISVGGSLGGLLPFLGPLVAASGKFFTKGAEEAGAGGPVSPLSGGLTKIAEMAPEAASLLQKLGFAGTGGHPTGAGAGQAAAGGLMGKLLGAILPSTGTLSTTVEKFRQDTVGIAASEQIGMVRNSVVGVAMLTSVGKLHKTVVGEDSTLEAKKSIFNRTVIHTLHAKEKFVIAGPGGSITIDQSGITIKAVSLTVKSPSVDFTSGSPDQVEALKSDKPFVQECPAKK